MATDKVKKVLRMIILGLHEIICMCLCAIGACILMGIQLLACCSFGSGNVFYMLLGSIWLGGQWYFMYYCWKKDKEENDEESILDQFK